MRTFNVEAFNGAISNTGVAWYSPARLDSLLGGSESIAIQAWVTNVSGTSPTLVVQLEHSADSENWLPISGTPEISTGISSNTSYYGRQLGLSPVLLAYVRFKVTLGGTNPSCSLKLGATGRTVV